MRRGGVEIGGGCISVGKRMGQGGGRISVSGGEEGSGGKARFGVECRRGNDVGSIGGRRYSVVRWVGGRGTVDVDGGGGGSIGVIGGNEDR